MAIVKCNNGHFYDDAAYHGKCPHCKVESELLKKGSGSVIEDDKTVAMSLDEINIVTNYTEKHDKSMSESAPALMGRQDIMGGLFDQKLDTLEEEDKDKTVSLFNAAKAVNPVTGWLVCTNGKEAGKDYRLHAGKNFLGRSMTMDIPIVGDKTVARVKHCAVVYDPMENQFFLSAEEGNVVYLNDKTIESYVEIKADDVIRVGETELVMIPYCKEERKWENN